MHFFDSIQTSIVGQFDIAHLILAMLVIATLFLLPSVITAGIANRVQLG